MTIDEITVRELKAKLDNKEDFQLIDVREPVELEICRIDGSVNIPMRDIISEEKKLDCNKEYIIHCRSGHRSADVVEFLKNTGHKKVKNLKGGILEWIREIDHSMQSY